ncbi:MAG TPA: helix-turn-helix domain-containing protein [Steroidobacteraceae bacterium]|nr:helix-turn-helix domain-containing protein [Steroidobacteraceae bacterium]
MSTIRYRPAAPLDRYVDCFWWSQRNEPQLHCEHMLPSGTAQLIFALHDKPIACWMDSSQANSLTWTRALLHGPQWGYFVSGPKPCGVVAGVSFRPGAAGCVLGLPMTELTDRHVTLDTLWGAAAQSLHERLREAGKPPAVFQVIEQELMKRLERPLLIHPAIAHALAPHATGWAQTRVMDIQREAGYSPRHFIALFRAAVGLTPKHYYRVERFTAALQSLASNRGMNLANLAASLGYSDQAHLTREFRDFAGITPRQYRPRGPDSAFHHVASGLTSPRSGAR